MEFDTTLVLALFIIFGVLTFLRLLASLPIYRLIKTKYHKVFIRYFPKDLSVHALFLNPRDIKFNWDLLFTTKLHLSEGLAKKVKILKVVAYLHFLTVLLLLIYVLSFIY